MVGTEGSRRNPDDPSERAAPHPANTLHFTDDVDTKNARHRRQDALSAIAQAANAVQSEPPSAAPEGQFKGLLSTSGRRRPGMIIFSALVLLALVMVGVYGYQRLTAKSVAAIPLTLRINLLASKLYCPTYFAWSPDSLSVAVIAQAEDCNDETQPQNALPDETLSIFDARTGALEQRAPLTSTLTAANLTGSAMAVVWSRDGQSLFVICAVRSASGQTGVAALLVAWHVGNTHARLYANSLGGYPQAGVIWSTSGAHSVAPVTPPLAPALTYFWSRGEVAPREAFPAVMGGFTGPGDRSARGVFSFWQPGTITPILSPDASITSNQPPFALIYNALTNETAPDSASFVSGLSLYARLQPPAGAGYPYRSALCTTAETKDACLAPVIPYADKALLAVASAVQQGVRSGARNTLWQAASVAWRPDGTYLAAILPADGFFSNKSDAQVTIYRTTTGAAVAHFTASRTLMAGWDALGVSPVQWSPSGQQLALADFGSSSITIWDVRGLST